MLFIFCSLFLKQKAITFVLATNTHARHIFYCVIERNPNKNCSSVEISDSLYSMIYYIAFIAYKAGYYN